MFDIRTELYLRSRDRDSVRPRQAILTVAATALVIWAMALVAVI